MNAYLTFLGWSGAYIFGGVVTAYILYRFGGNEMRAYEGRTVGDTLNGAAAFLIIVWPMLVFALTVCAAFLVAVSPVLVPALLLGRFLFRKLELANPTPHPPSGDHRSGESGVGQ